MTHDIKWIATRWYCIRHALVPESEHKNMFYGNMDVGCIPHMDLATWHTKILPPENIVLITSALKRTTQTADAIQQAGLWLPVAECYESLNEMCFGHWQGQPADNYIKGEDKSFWYTPAHYRIAGGESFGDLYARVSNTMLTQTIAHAGKNIISITHGGTIRAMIAYAMGLPISTAIDINIDNQSVSLLEHFHSQNKNGNILQQGKWRIHYINKLPHKSPHE